MPKWRVSVGLAVLLCLLTLQFSSRTTAEENPLDQLRERSAETRWKSLRERFSERREERKDRKHKEDATSPLAADHKAEQGDSVNDKPLAAPAMRPVEADLPGESRGSDPAPAYIAPPLQPVPALPSKKAAAEMAPAPPAAAPEGEDLKSVARALESAGPLYQEIFQLEVAASTGVESTAAVDSTDEPLPMPSDPHPGMLKTVSETSVKKSSSPALSAPLASVKTTTTNQLLLPELPLPDAPPSELRLSYQDSPLLRDPSTPIPLPSRDRFVFNTSDYFKEIDEIMPFADYEPSAQQREKDPYHNLCEHPQRSNNPASQCPEIADMPNEDSVYVKREFAHLQYPWVAPNICYNPLYFEDVNLERYGHMHHPVVQPFVSLGKFSGQFLALPYQMTMKPPRMAVYPLGYLPPGDICNPKLYYQIPFNAQAAMVTVGVYTGWFFLIP